MSEPDVSTWPTQTPAHHSENQPSILNAGRVNGVVSTGGGFSDLDSSVPICPFLSSWDFPDFFRDFPGWSGDFPNLSFPLSQPMNSTYEEQS